MRKTHRYCGLSLFRFSSAMFFALSIAFSFQNRVVNRTLKMFWSSLCSFTPDGKIAYFPVGSFLTSERNVVRPIKYRERLFFTSEISSFGLADWLLPIYVLLFR